MELLLKLRQAEGRCEDIASGAELLCSDGGKLSWRIVRKPQPRRLGLAKVRHRAMKSFDSVRLAEKNEAVSGEVSQDSVNLAGCRCIWSGNGNRRDCGVQVEWTVRGDDLSLHCFRRSLSTRQPADNNGRDVTTYVQNHLVECRRRRYAPHSHAECTQ